MVNKSKISVITPNYNCAPFLMQAIESVKNQTYQNIEHIVIDGASTDNSVDILKQYRHLIWKSEPDKGMNDAVNKGFRISTGDILCYLNSDDFFYANALQEVHDFFQEHPHIDMVISDFDVCDDNGEIMMSRKVAPLNFKELLFGGVFICQPAVFWRRSLYEKVGDLDISLRFAPDYDYFYRMGLAGAKTGIIKKNIVAFRLRIDSNTIALQNTKNGGLKFINKHWKPFSHNERVNEILLRVYKFYFRGQHFIRRLVYRKGYIVVISGNARIRKKYKGKG